MPNLLLYVIDALRADHLSCYGYHRPTTPHIDALAADPLAVRFTHAYSPSTWTKPVAASILSGCYPPAHGVRTRNDLFIRNVPRLPEVLQSAGYRTAAVSTIGNVSSALGFGVGFDHFVDLYKDPALVDRRQVSNTGAWKLYFESDTTVVLPLAEDVNDYALSWLQPPGAGEKPSFFREAGRLGPPEPGVARQARPWFLFLWVLDPHDPYYPPPGFDRWRDPGYQGRIDGSAESVRRVRSQADRQRLVDLYDGEIAYTDDQFGRLVSHLKAIGAYDDTLIVVAGDHGEAFGEHGDFVHGHLAYEEVMRVPLVMKFPASAASPTKARPSARPLLPAGPRVCETLAQLTDIAPTVLDALGLQHLSAGMQGYSLWPVLRGAAPPRNVVYAETQSSAASSRLLAARTERWKYLRSADPAVELAKGADKARAGGRPDSSLGNSIGEEPQALGWRQRFSAYWEQLRNPEMLKKVLRNPMFYLRRQMAEREMLFDLASDPGEQENVIDRHPAAAQELRACLESWLAECRVYATLSEQHAPGLGLDEATRRQLEGLGYL